MIKALSYTILLLAMAAFGLGVYHAAAALRADNGRVVKPDATSGPSIPGTLYMAQDGAIYRLRGGQFAQVTDSAGWTAPAASPDGSQLVAVKRTGDYSDLYLLTSTGRVERQLTHHQSSQVESNRWAFFPRFSPDGTSIFYSYDIHDPYATYLVDLAVFSISLDGQQVIQWTTPNDYTGGDANPVPIAGGALIFTRYSIDDQSQVHSQVWMIARPGSPGVALTPPDQNCASPAVSADAKLIAMVCRHDQLQSNQVVVAPLDTANYQLGPEAIVVQGQLAAVPAFSPDGKTLAFLAPVTAGGAFQLWTAASAAITRSAAHPLTQSVGLDSTAAPAWVR